MRLIWTAVALYTCYSFAVEGHTVSLLTTLIALDFLKDAIIDAHKKTLP